MDLKVFITNQDSTCDECGEKLGHHAWITLVEGFHRISGPRKPRLMCALYAARKTGVRRLLQRQLLAFVKRRM
jgi:hypothetical protein